MAIFPFFTLFEMDIFSFAGKISQKFPSDTYIYIYIYIYGQQVTTSVGWFSIFFVVGEPLELVPSYCYFLKEPPGKVLNFFIKKSRTSS
jgi:hypothetical protein